jgi:hypothetical protein
MQGVGGWRGGGGWGRAEGVVSLVPMLAMAWHGLWHYIGTNAGTREHSNWFKARYIGALGGICAQNRREMLRTCWCGRGWN